MIRVTFKRELSTLEWTLRARLGKRLANVRSTKKSVRPTKEAFPRNHTRPLSLKRASRTERLRPVGLCPIIVIYRAERRTNFVSRSDF